MARKKQRLLNLNNQFSAVIEENKSNTLNPSIETFSAEDYNEVHSVGMIKNSNYSSMVVTNT